MGACDGSVLAGKPFTVAQDLDTGQPKECHESLRIP